MARLLVVLLVVAAASLVAGQNSSVTPVVSGSAAPVKNPAPLVSSGPVPWPLDPVTKERYPGLKEFVIVLHDNLVYEKAELDAWFNNTYEVQLKTSLKNLLALRNTTAAKMIPYDRRIETVENQIIELKKSLAVLEGQIADRARDLAKAEKVVLNTQINWNNTISGLEMQQRAASSAIADVNKIFPLLTSPDNRENIAQMLMSTQTKVAQQSSKVASLLEMAIEQAQFANGVEEMKDLLGKLKKQLESHLTDLQQDLAMARNSRNTHVASLKQKVLPYTVQLKRLRESTAVTAAALPTYLDMIKNINKEAEGLHQAIQVIDNRIQRVEDTMNEVNSIYVRETADVNARMTTFETLHQEIKSKLLSASDNDKKILLSCKNLLQPVSSVVEYWNPYFADVNAATNFSSPKPILNNSPYGMLIPKPVDPRDSASNLCGSWQFEEANGNPYAIDSSGYGHDGWLHGMDLQRMQGHNNLSKALLFDGMQSYIDLGRMSYFGESLNQFTISMWVRTLDTHDALSSLVKYIDDGMAGVLALEPNRRVGRPINGVFPVGQQGETTLDFQSGATLAYLRDSEGNVLAGHVMAPYFDNRWHHIQWTVIDAKLNKMAFYMDGKLYPWVATIENSPAKFRKLHRNIYIGAGNNRGTPEGFFDGAIDDVRFFCGQNISISGGYCARVCVNETEACGDMCIPQGKVCHLPAGSACNPPSPPPVLKPVTPAPTVAPETPKYHRGDTSMNKESLFPGKVVPKGSEPALKS